MYHVILQEKNHIYFFKNKQFQNLKNLVVEIDGKNKFKPHCSSNKLDIRKHQSQ